MNRIPFVILQETLLSDLSEQQIMRELRTMFKDAAIVRFNVLVTVGTGGCYQAQPLDSRCQKIGAEDDY